MGGGALGSENVSRLVGKEVSKKLRNFTLALLGRADLRTDGAKSFSLAPWGEGVRSTGEGSRVEIAQLVRDDRYRHAELVSASQTQTVGRIYQSDDETEDPLNASNQAVSGSQMQVRGVSSRDNKILTRISKFTAFTKKFYPLPEVEGKRGFTLAEVLITLGVIGIVAVLTLPSVINSTKDKQYKAARYKALSTIGSASKMIATQDRMNDATSVEDFVKNYLGEQISIAKTCDNDNLEYCGIPKKIKTINGDEIEMPKSALKTGQHGTETRVYGMYKDAKSYGFLTADGYSYNLFYFPKCSGTKLTGKNGYTNAMQYPCVNAIYDMNGLKGPNQVGKDIGFVTVFYPNETVQAVAPMPEKQTSTGTLNYSNAQKYCAEKGKFIPNVDEAMSITLNAKLINTNLSQEYIWTTNAFKCEYGFMANFIITLYNIMLYSSHPASANYTLCVGGN